ncbi:MAG: hypothetical protein AAFN11_07715 [Chloroflexota bacterium]
MATKQNPQSWEKIEEQAYHAFREWGIWLVLRQTELSAHLQQAKASTGTPLAEISNTLAQPPTTKTRLRSES